MKSLLRNPLKRFHPCQRKFCGHEATSKVVVRFSNGVTVESNGILCDRHFNSMNIGELLTVEAKASISRHCKKIRKPKPDFKTATKERGGNLT